MSHLCWNFRTTYGARNRVGIGLSYQPASVRICKPLRRPGIDSQSGRVDFSESIPGLLKRLQIRPLAIWAGEVDFSLKVPFQKFNHDICATLLFGYLLYGCNPEYC
jgi:hypothetical protein